MRLVLIAALVAWGCDGSNVVAIDAAPIEPDAHVDYPDDGFGEPCTPVFNPDHLYSECRSLENLPGYCALNFCRRPCGPTSPCPSGFMTTQSTEGTCWCEPVP
jgi:hypothetical protein